VSVFSREFLQDKQELVAFIAATLTITIVLGRHYLRVTCTSSRKMITVRVTLHLLCPLLPPSFCAVVKNAFRKT